MSVELEAPATPYEEFYRVLRARGPTLNLLFEQARVSPEREGDTILRDAFAGAVISVLYGMLRAYWLSIGGTKWQWRCSGPTVGGYSIGQILAAALDNARHFEDWDSEKAATIVQLRSVRVLSAVLALELKKNSKRLPFRGNVSWAILGALTRAEGYRALETLVREFAQALPVTHAT